MPKKSKQNHVVKENVVSINPALKESFLKFSPELIDKNRIKDNFSGETNGNSKDHVSSTFTIPLILMNRDYFGEAVPYWLPPPQNNEVYQSSFDNSA